MKQLLIALCLMIATDSAFAICEIRRLDGSVAGSVVKEVVLDDQGTTVGSRVVGNVKTGQNNIAGYSDVVTVPVYGAPSYQTALISNVLLERLGQATGESILDKKNEVVGTFNPDCSLSDAGAAALLLIFNAR